MSPFREIEPEDQDAPGYKADKAFIDKAGVAVLLVAAVIVLALLINAFFASKNPTINVRGVGPVPVVR